MSKTSTKINNKRKLNKAVSLEKQIPKPFSSTKNRSASAPLLYQLVYFSRISFITVFILLLSFVFQGTSLTYADELTESVESSQAITSSLVEQEEVRGVQSELTQDDTHNFETIEKDINNTTVNEVIIASDLFEVDAMPGIVSNITTDEPPPLYDLPITVDDLVISSTSSDPVPENEEVFPFEEVISTSTATSTPPDEVLDNPDDKVASTTESELASTTLEVATSTLVLEEAVTITGNDTEFTFNHDECTTLASGSFYCLKDDTKQLEDALFAAPDIDGDLEIYLVRNGTQSQVTSNLVDDAAPFFDQNSDTMVWHRLIADRYQIISYDISSGIETQLTAGENNSMEPTRQGKYTVWQSWSDNNWNIVLLDGNERRTITESSAHDIAPYVHGSLVVWNRYNNGKDKTIEMYDMISETYVTVDDPEGLSVTNPRMVFVYDSLHPNGDVVTKGYDMISRKFIQLDTLPRQLPDELPESESTGETRALIQSKPTVKSDESVQNNNATSSGFAPPGSFPPASTDPLTLDLTVATSSDLVTPPVPQVPAMAEYELIIPPLELHHQTVQE